ncbi:MAG: MBL fold metallo-hydrolase [Alphaproteobacteria bacterium]|nr:MBL fold metallo-hydrolase [Alphaproteobacteria bacterium]
MKVTILGCGGAGGVPMISVGWRNCNPENPKNRRRRPSILIQHENTNILVDTSPDLREQLLDVGVNRLDAVLYTHEHADHVHGIDDLREVNRIIKKPLQIYGDDKTLCLLKERFAYAFEPIDIKNEPIFHPCLVENIIKPRETIGSIEFLSFEQSHGWTSSLGFRFGDFAYSTDVVELDDNAFSVLKGVKVWIIGCLLDREHSTHAHVDKVIDWVSKVNPELSILTHMGPSLDYDRLKADLPENIVPAYDGMVIER